MGADSIAKRRILFFNWAPFDHAGGWGGGVTVYLRNLLDVLSRRDDLEIFFLSSGTDYSRFRRGVRLVPSENVFSDRGVKSFVIVNSPVRAPARQMFHEMDTWRKDQHSADLVRGLLKDHGPFDAVHIHNLEGISSAVLELRPEFPQTRFFYTWHNYIPLCPQVHLLFQDRQDCQDYGDGARCVGCVEQRGEAGWSPVNYDTAVQPGSLAFDPRPGLSALAAGYRGWRETNIDLFNQVIDGSIAVSRTVKETIVPLGIEADTITVLPPGMDVHKTHAEMKAAWAAKSGHDAFTFSFIGYGDPAKGLPFMADALEMAASKALKAKADLIVVARLTDQERRNLLRLENAFRKVTYIHGHTRDQLAEIAALSDVNIVPSIWRETYNQVAYEMLCMGTPCMLSSSVGLGMFYTGKEDFLFEAGQHRQLVAKMEALVCAPEKMAAFWDVPVELPSMEEHADGLLAVLLG